MLAFASFALLVAAASACQTVCNFNWAPLCGSDGRTYANRCEMDSFNCLRKSAITVAYAGECRSTTSTCNNLCHMNWAPVCGTDGRTYGNQCELDSAACRTKGTKSAVSLAYAGECLKQTTCQTKCNFNWAPVCGSDGRTYGNQCELESLACLKRLAVTVAHAGECVAQASTSCNRLCTANWAPVCGTDGHTYGNRCELDSVACMSKGTKAAVKFAYVGECRKQTTCQTKCNFNWAPVCGSDGRTYGNQCELESLACMMRKAVTVAHAGECVEKTATCNRACPRNWAPVCGTDGRTYGNRCEFDSVACLKKNGLAIAKVGQC